MGNPEPQETSPTQPLVQETSNPRTKTQQPKVDFEPIHDKPKKEVKVDDLQRETKETRSEIGALKQNLQALQKTQSLESLLIKAMRKAPQIMKSIKQPTLEPILSKNPAKSCS